MNRQDIVATLGRSRLHDDELDALIVSNTEVKVHEVIDEQTDVLIAALETLRDLFDPEVIVLGGYLGSLVKARTNHILGTLNSNSLKERGVDFLVPRAAELLDMVLVGAAQKAWEELLKDPTLISEGSLA
jgi:predicted NBD/HSP70 family sugar kinase